MGQAEPAPNGLLAFCDESDDEGIQRQRLDQCQAEEESEADAGLCSRVAGHGFGAGGAQLALSDAAKAGSDAHGDVGEGQAEVRASDAATSGVLLREDGAGQRQKSDGQEHEFTCHAGFSLQ